MTDFRRRSICHSRVSVHSIRTWRTVVLQSTRRDERRGWPFTENCSPRLRLQLRLRSTLSVVVDGARLAQGTFAQYRSPYEPDAKRPRDETTLDVTLLSICTRHRHVGGAGHQKPRSRYQTDRVAVKRLMRDAVWTKEPRFRVPTPGLCACERRGGTRSVRLLCKARARFDSQPNATLCVRNYLHLRIIENDCKLMPYKPTGHLNRGLTRLPAERNIPRLAASNACPLVRLVTASKPVVARFNYQICDERNRKIRG